MMRFLGVTYGNLLSALSSRTYEFLELLLLQRNNLLQRFP
jgi:hypothetical protein